MMECGEQCAIIPGIHSVQWWFADSLDMPLQVCHAAMLFVHDYKLSSRSACNGSAADVDINSFPVLSPPPHLHPIFLSLKA